MNEQGSRRSQVVEQQENLGNTIACLDEVLKGLEERLAKVLTPAVPQCRTDDSAKTKRELVGLAADLANNVDKLNILRNKLDSIVERLEL